MPLKLARRVASAAAVALVATALASPTSPARATGPLTPITHVVVIVQENHSFDNYFGPYCAASGTCNLDAQVKNPYAPLQPVPVNDATGASYDPNHDQACELAEMNGGKMDGYVAPHPSESFATSYPCGNPLDFAEAGTDSTSTSALYQQWAETKASLADNFFQPIAGASSSNDMYLWTSQYVFTDNSVEPDAAGKQCSTNTNLARYDDATHPNLGHLLDGASVGWSWYAEGYHDMVAAGSSCPIPPATCPVATYPCVFDPSDIPSQYYASSADNPAHMRDYTQFDSDIAAGQLPAVSFVKAIGYRSEHPGYGSRLSEGVDFVRRTVDAIEQNPDLASNTLVLLTWDESGGYFDHVAPPASIETYPGTSTPVPYGPRVPLLALGRFARIGTVSHTQMEHSSITSFIEWNWLGASGQLGGRDTTVNGIGSLLDPSLNVPS